MARDLTSIERLLRENCSELWGQYQDVEQLASQVMPRAHATFWNYSDHGVEHLKGVIGQADLLLTSEVRDSLNPEELFTLLAGATWHDLGMVTAKPLDEDEANELRGVHQDVGAKEILNAPESYGIPPEFRSAVAAVVRHHRRSDIGKEVGQTLVATATVKLPLLCALVRAADELDIVGRAPHVLAEILELPDESAVHFVTTQAVTGVAADSTTGVVKISAEVKTEDMERALYELKDKINEELGALGAIFVESGLPDYRAALGLERSAVVYHKVVRALCNAVQSVDELVEATGEAESDVECSKDELTGDRVLEIESREGGCEIWAIRKDVEVFKRVAEGFLDTDEAVKFLQSEYGQEMLRGRVFDRLREAFSAHYDEVGAEIRRDVLCASPTAVRFALLSSEVARRSSAMSRRVLLDQALSLGLTNDIYLHTEVCDLLDVSRALRHLGRSVSQSAPNFARLVARAWFYREKSLQEMHNEFLHRYVGAPAPGADTRFRFSMKWPCEPQFLSAPHLLVAASDEGVPLEIASPELLDFEIEGSSIESKVVRDETSMCLTIQPSQRLPDLPRWRRAVDVQWDEASDTCTIKVDTERSYNQERYPFRMELTDVDGNAERMDFSFLKHDGAMTSAQALNWIALQPVLRGARGPVRFELVDEQTGAAVVLSDAEPKQRPSGEVSQGNGIVAGLTALREAERRLGTEVLVPLLPTAQQREKLIALSEQIEEMTDDELRSAIESGLGAEKPELTLIRIIARDHEGQTLIDECPAVFPGFILTFKPTLTDPEEQARVEREIAERTSDAVLQYRAQESPAEVVRQFFASVEKGAPSTPCYRCDSTPPLPTHVQYTIKAVEERQWERVQEIVCEIRPQNEAWRRFDAAFVHGEEQDVAAAEEELVQCVVDYPLLAPAHCQLGIDRYDLKQIDAAERALRNAVEIPHNQEECDDEWEWQQIELARNLARRHLGIIQLHRGNVDAAIEEFRQVDPGRRGDWLDETVEMIEQRLTAKGIYVEECQQAIAALRQLVEEA